MLFLRKEYKTIYTREQLLSYLPTGAVVAEIGTHMGEFANSIWRTARPRLLYLIDPWAADKELINGRSVVLGEDCYQNVIKRFSPEIETGNIKVIREGCCEALPKLGCIFDWVYLDAFHCYPATLRELRACSKAVKPGGLITGHDYNLKPVERSVQEFCQEEGWRIKLITQEEWCSFVLQKVPGKP